MGWDIRTIRIVNSETAEVEKSIKDYYVYDLPEITRDEDYLVGNWLGYVNFNNGHINKVKIFISENSDGYYNVIHKGTVTKASDDGSVEVGWYGVNQITGTYDSSTGLFKATAESIDYNSERMHYYAGSYVIYKLQDEILYFYDGNPDAADGYLTRF